MKKSYTAGFKSKVAIEAIKGEKTLAELASIYQVHVSQIRQWKLFLEFLKAKKRNVKKNKKSELMTFTNELVSSK